MGFISNPEEEAFLNTDSAMNMMALHLVDAFAAYTHRNAPAQTVTADSIQTTLDRAETEPRQLRDSVESATPPTPTTQTYYAVQICASKTPLSANDPRLKGHQAEYTVVGDWYKYYVGASTVREEAVAKQKELKAQFPDCWVIKVEK